MDLSLLLLWDLRFCKAQLSLAVRPSAQEAMVLLLQKPEIYCRHRKEKRYIKIFSLNVQNLGHVAIYPMQANKCTSTCPNCGIHILTTKQKVCNIDQCFQLGSSHQSILSQKVTCNLKIYWFLNHSKNINKLGNQWRLEQNVLAIRRTKLTYRNNQLFRRQ